MKPCKDCIGTCIDGDCKLMEVYKQGREDEISLYKLSEQLTVSKGYELGYKQGRKDGITEYFKALNRNNLIRNDNDLITASLIADEIKEK